MLLQNRIRRLLNYSRLGRCVAVSLIASSAWLKLGTLHADSLTANAKQVDIWYPFLKDGRWGFINANGEWKITPAYDMCYLNFEGDLARAWMKDKWGYIDRTGHWIAKPQFSEPIMDFNSSGVQIVYDGKKCGVLWHEPR